MTGSKTGYCHVPVLAEETINALNVRADGKYADGTLGGGGHASLICRKLSKKGTFIGIDRDREALTAAKQRLEEYRCNRIFENSNYLEIKAILKKNNIEKIDGGLLDLGVSSFQLDHGDRGFSYMNDAPLDMRMNRDDDLTAENVVNTYSEQKLTETIRKYGEERWASRISKFIVKARQDAPVTTTGQLTEIIKAAIPASARRNGPHPAKRTFQAIRIEVNNELAPLEDVIENFIDVLDSGGRLAVISFHSLEDRAVKEVFRRREDPCICPKDLPECVCGKVADAKRISKRPITAGIEEVEKNPRARSAKLRILEKL